MAGGNEIAVGVLRLENGVGLKLPEYATGLSAGADLLAAIDDDITIPPGGRELVPSGIAIELPAGFEAQVRPRSGLALKYGVTVLNSPGTIDADYRGEVKVILINHGSENFTISRGQRIAQMVVCPVSRVVWNENASLGESTRGAGGFGSTGSHEHQNNRHTDKKQTG